MNVNPRKNYYKVRDNVVYDIDGASCGADEKLVDAIRAAVRAKMERRALEIPRLPKTAGRILQLSQDPNAAVQDVHDAILVDPVLAARVLSLANAASMGGGVAGLEAAILRLGLKKLRDLVFAESMRSTVFPAKGYRGLLEPSWRTSLGAAVACEALATYAKVPREGAFLIGLLHDIGKPTLVYTILEYERKNAGRSMGDELVEIVLSQLHEEIGAYVLQEWGMPEDAVEAARAHHRYSEKENRPRAHGLIYAANLFCEQLGLGETQRDVSFNLERAFVDLGLSDRDAVDKILNGVARDVEKLLAGLGVKDAART